MALTLRHDCLDSFWFCLMREFAHVVFDLDDEASVFLDEMSSDCSGAEVAPGISAHIRRG